MTLQDRYDAVKERARQLGQQHQQARQQIVQMEHALIRADAEMALLEALLAESSAPLKLVEPAGSVA